MGQCVTLFREKEEKCNLAVSVCGKLPLSNNDQDG